MAPQEPSHPTRTFRYEAVSADGTTVRGSLEAADGSTAALVLRERGLVPTYVGTSSRTGRHLARLPGFGQHRLALRFSEDLACLLLAGATLERALGVIAEASETRAEADLARQVLGVLRGGRSLADALSGWPDHFSPLYVNTVRTGETSGSLAEVIEQLAVHERRRERLRTDVASALAYPCLLITVGLGAVLVILLYVVPRFSSSMLISGFEPPLPMVVLLGASSAVQSGWPLLAALAAAAVLGLGAWLRSPSGRLRFDTLLLRTPLLGACLRKAETARFARAMATMLGASVPLVESLQATHGVISNRAMAAALAPVVQGVRSGQGVARPLARTGAFPRLATRLLLVGEETGALAPMFGRLAGIYEVQTGEALKRFTTLFEPFVILFLGTVIGVMILGLLTALTSLQATGI